MKIRVLFLLLFILLSAMPVVAEDLPDYTATVVDKIPGMKLSIDCVIQKPVDREALQKLAAEVYEKNKGEKYRNVFIMWYLPNYKIGNGTWATTNYMGDNLTVSIMALQGE